jgi:hypothetical protein
MIPVFERSKTFRAFSSRGDREPMPVIPTKRKLLRTELGQLES